MCPHAELLLGRATGVDTEHRRVTVETEDGIRTLAYDELVVALGAISRTLPIPGLADHALGFKSLADAIRLRNHVLRRLEAATAASTEEERRRELTFVFVGAGYAGVEALAELADLVRDALRYYPTLRDEPQHWVLVDAASKILPEIPAKLGDYAAQQLAGRGVDIRVETTLESVEAHAAALSDGSRILTSTVVWTAGVRASEVGSVLGLSLGRQARVQVLPTLQVEGHPEVFVIGDLAGPIDKSDGGSPLPMLIPVAMQEGRHVGATIRDVLRGYGATNFRYKDPGIMATIGRNSAVAQLGPVRLTGFLGWLMWLGVHLINVISFRSPLVVLVNWAWDYLFYDRPIRLIVRAATYERDKD